MLRKPFLESSSKWYQYPSNNWAFLDKIEIDFKQSEIRKLSVLFGWILLRSGLILVKLGVRSLSVEILDILDNFRGEKQPRIPQLESLFCKIVKMNLRKRMVISIFFGNFILSVCGCKLQGCVIQFLEPPSRSLAMQHRSSPSWVTKTSRSGDERSWTATFGRWLVEKMLVNV